MILLRPERRRGKSGPWEWSLHPWGMAPIDSHMIDDEVWRKPTKTERTSYSSLSSFIGKPLPPKTLVVFRGSVGSVREECSLIGSWNLPTVVLDSTHLFRAAADLCCQRFPQLLRRTPHFQWLCYSGDVSLPTSVGWKRITSWNYLFFRKEPLVWFWHSCQTLFLYASSTSSWFMVWPCRHRLSCFTQKLMLLLMLRHTYLRYVHTEYVL